MEKGFITAAAVAPDGTIWASDEERALWRIDKTGARKVTGDVDEAGRVKAWSGTAPRDTYIYAIAVDPHGRVWIGTGRNGVAVYDPSSSGKAQWTHIGPEQGLGGRHVYALHAASDGSVWVATEVGLSHIQTTGKIKTYLTIDGLPSNQLCDIVEDKLGRIWVAGWLGGVARIDPRSRGAKAAVRKFSSSSLVSDEIHDLHLDSKGNLWIAGNGGVTVLNSAGNAFA